MDVDFDDDAVAGHDGVPLLSSMTAMTHSDPFDTEGALNRLVWPELGPDGNYNLEAVLRLCCGIGCSDHAEHGFHSLPMGCGGEVVMRVPASGRGSVTGVLSEKKEAFAGLDLDVIRREVPACLRNPVTRNGVPSKGEITSPSGTQVLAQVRSTRIDGFQSLTFTTIPADLLDTYSVEGGHDILFLDAGKSRNTRQCSIDQERRWLTGTLASVGSYFSPMHVDLFHYAKEAAVMVVEDNAFAAKLWWFGRSRATAQIHSRDRQGDNVCQMRRLLSEALAMYESGHGTTDAQSIFCLQLPNQAVSFAATVPHAVFNLGNPEGKMCVSVGVYDYMSVTPRDVAAYMSSDGAGESEEEMRDTFRLLVKHRESGFREKVMKALATLAAGQETRLATRVVQEAVKSLRAMAGAAARWAKK